MFHSGRDGLIPDPLEHLSLYSLMAKALSPKFQLSFDEPGDVRGF